MNMITAKQQLSKKEEKLIWLLMEEMSDEYNDFYITRNNLRLYIKQNIELLFDCLRKGDKIVFADKEGIVFITGWSDDAQRKYIKILSRDNEGADRLIKVSFQNVECDLYAKVKKNSPIKTILEKNRFKWVGNRGKEVLLCHKHIPIKSKKEN